MRGCAWQNNNQLFHYADECTLQSCYFYMITGYSQKCCPKSIRNISVKFINSPQCCSSLKSLQSSCLLHTSVAAIHFPLLHKNLSPVQLSTNRPNIAVNNEEERFEVRFSRCRHTPGSFHFNMLIGVVYLTVLSSELCWLMN